MTVLSEVQAVVERAILDEYAPTGVLINDKYEILHFLGETDRYLMPPTGKPRFNVLDMVREDLKNKLTITIHKAVREKTNTLCKDVRVRYNGTISMIDISVKQMTGTGLPPGLMLVIFEDESPADVSGKKKAATGKTEKQAHALQSLEQELQSTREYLQATIEEMETSNEELTSTNEELQSVNEELQSTNEELKMNADELMPEGQQRELKSFLEKLKGGEDIKSFTSRRKTKAGKILDVWLTVNALADESGRPIEIATTERDLAWLAEKSEGNDENGVSVNGTHPPPPSRCRL